jgi:hypothetical protein
MATREAADSTARLSQHREMVAGKKGSQNTQKSTVSRDYIFFTWERFQRKKIERERVNSYTLE